MATRLSYDVDFESLERAVMREFDDLVWRSRDAIVTQLRAASTELANAYDEIERLQEEVTYLRDEIDMQRYEAAEIADKRHDHE